MSGSDWAAPNGGKVARFLKAGAIPLHRDDEHQHGRLIPAPAPGVIPHNRTLLVVYVAPAKPATTKPGCRPS